MMMVRFLCQSNLGLEPQNLCPVFAQGTVHIVVSMQNFTHPVSKCGNHFWVIIQIAGFDEFNIGVRRRHLVGKAVNTVDQYAGKQKIREQHNTAVSKLCHMFKTGFNKRECDA